jgi:hypothetical protein
MSRLVLIGMVLWVGLAFGADLPTWTLPRLDLTPGQARSDMTEEAMCATKWGKDARHVTEAMKREVYARYGLTNHKGICAQSPRGCEVDHSVSRELLGEDVIENLWIQPYVGKNSNKWGAEKKDALENKLHKLVCAGEIDLATAQEEISTDWIESYKRRMKQ